MSTVGDIPEELRERPQWVLHRDKVPHAPGARKASSTDSQTWSTFENVLDMAHTGQYDGIGFVLSSGDPYVGVDLDDCIDGGAIEPWAVEIVEALASYTEVSPSGSGLHIIAKGKLPVGGCKTSMPGGGELEMYARERYLTVTGDVLDKAHGTPEDRSDELKAIHAEHFGSSTGGAGTRSGAHVNGLAGPGNDLAGAALVQKAKQAKNGEAFTRLWNGDTSAHDHDHSKADLALCSSLAFWTSGDASQIDELFRESGLMRPKWDEDRGAQTYGEHTIRKALENQSDFYTPSNGRAAAGSGGGAEKGEDDRTQSQVLIDLASGADLFHDEDREPYATFETAEGHALTAPVFGSDFADFLRLRFYQLKGKPPSAQALQDAKNVLGAQAKYEGERRKVHLRVAGHGEEAFGKEASGKTVYVDLADENGSIVEITASGGWQIRSAGSVPVKFRRAQATHALPPPEHGGSLGLLRKYVRTPSEGDFALLLAFLVAALRPSGPYPVLCLTGEQGTGKSTVTKMIRKLVDPYGMDTRSKPKSPRDLAVGAHNTWLLAFNNLSGIPRWLSDGFCRLSDGSGYGVRKNYEDRDEVVFYHQRPLVLNGIERLATRPDLADRAVRLQLERIPKSERKTESELWAAFDRDRPLILGALFDAVSEALANIDDVHVEEFERMADFSAWAVAAEPTFPTDDGTFLRAYEGNRQEASRETAESNPVASAICEMIEAEGDWTGKTKPLRKDLKSYLPDPKRPPADFPETYQAMGAELRRLLPVLRDLGIEKVDDPRERSRQFTLRQIEGRREANEANEARATGQRSHKRRSGRAHPPGASETEADASGAGSGRSSTEANGSARDEGAFNTPETTQTEGCPHRSLRAPTAGPESKDADSDDEATYDGETVTVVSRRGNVCIIEGGDGGRSSVPTDELDFHADVPF
jgi:hypothetical protein